MVFTLLAPPALEPAFPMQLAAFRLVQRVYSASQSRRTLVQWLASARQEPLSDGLLARILQLPPFRPIVEDFLRNRLKSDKWQHDLRESCREQTWRTLARERAQHFAGAERGVSRKATLAYLQDLTAEADTLQIQQDSGQNELVLLVPPSEDPRAKLKVLRLLLTAGLMTPERDHRRRKRKGIIRCACEGPAPTIEHISWYCKCYHRERREALQVVPNFKSLLR